jgi:hypothetical protein
MRQCHALGYLLLIMLLASSGRAQTDTYNRKHVDRDYPASTGQPGPGREMANGAGDIGKGAAKGAGDLGLGVVKGAASLATLHPVDAGISLGKGTVLAGKDVTVGAAKGTGKVVHGVGRAFKHLF